MMVDGKSPSGQARSQTHLHIGTTSLSYIAGLQEVKKDTSHRHIALTIPVPLFIPITSYTSTITILQLGLFHTRLIHIGTTEYSPN